MVQPLMPFSESATLDLNSAASRVVHLSELDNRQVAFAGLQSLICLSGDLGVVPSSAGLLVLSAFIFPHFKSLPVALFYFYFF